MKVWNSMSGLRTFVLKQRSEQVAAGPAPPCPCLLGSHPHLQGRRHVSCSWIGSHRLLRLESQNTASQTAVSFYSTLAAKDPACPICPISTKSVVGKFGRLFQRFNFVEMTFGAEPLWDYDGVVDCFDTDDLFQRGEGGLYSSSVARDVPCSRPSPFH